MLLHAVPTHNTTHIIYIAVVITDKRYCSYNGANTYTTESTDYTVCATVSSIVNSNSSNNFTAIAAAATVAAAATAATVTTQQYHIHIFKLSNTTGNSITTA
jgi:oligoribonuclease (3'-5' exoribonuclease)